MARGETLEDNTIYDSVFKTMLRKMPQLLVPFINECFSREYPLGTEIVQFTDEHQTPRGTVIDDSVFRLGDKIYHIECQSTPDTKMVLRMIEYDFSIALERAVSAGAPFQMDFPESCVLFLRDTPSTPDALQMRVNLPDGGFFMYQTGVVKAQRFTSDEIFDKHLLLLMPYYLMRYERELEKIAGDDQRTAQLIAECSQMRGKFEMLTLGAGDEVLYEELTELIITEEFVSEFSNLITAEGFSNSAKLSLELINKYPDLFNKEIWINNKNKSLEPLLNKTFRSKFTEREIIEALQNSMREEFSEEFFKAAQDLLEVEDVGSVILSKVTFDIDKVLTEEEIMKIVLNSSTNPFRGKLKSFLNQERTEKVLKNRKIDFQTFVEGIMKKNMAWQNRMIREANSGKIDILRSSGTLDQSMCELILSLDINILSDFIRLTKNIAPNALSFFVLNYILSVKEVDEDFCIENIEVFRNNNLLRALGEYCKNHDYQTALLMVCV